MQKSINPSYSQPSLSFTIRLNVSCTLVLTSLILAVVSPRIANGNTQGDPLQRLANSYVGIYQTAKAFKLFSGEYLSATGMRLNIGSFLELLNLMRMNALIVQQPAACFGNGAAAGCYLPFAELSLGQMLALASSLFMLGLIIAFWENRRLTAINTGLLVGLAGSLFCVGSANDLQPSQSVVQQLTSARVGLYQITLQSTDDKHYISQEGSNLWTLYYKNSPGLRKPSACYIWKSSLFLCYQVVKDIPLKTALLGVFGLVLLTPFLTWKIPSFGYK